MNQEAPGAGADELPATVSADALPTVQVDGVVWDQVVVGGTVYAVGSFSSARPAGAAAGVGEVARGNVLAYDIATGELLDWAPVVNGVVNSVDASADGSVVYLGGDFTSLNGEVTWRVGSVDAVSGRRVPVGASANGSVKAVEVSADGSTLYVGGAFTQVNSSARQRVAAVDLATQRLTSFSPTVEDYVVRALTVSPDGGSVVVGGSFTTVGGLQSPGLAVLEADGTARQPGAGRVVGAGGSRSAVMALAGDERGFYGVTYSRTGSFEGMFRASWDTGDLDVMADCHGDSYDVYPAGDVVYVASHAHDCSNIGGFPDAAPNQYWHAPAFTSDATGETLPTTDTNYYDYSGQPAATNLHFYPSFQIGSYTGTSQATWTVEGNDEYVVYGGEFLSVNGTAQQGLVRFARRDIAPNQQGPVNKGGAYPLTASSEQAGRVDLSFSTNWDRDDQALTYAVYRDVDAARSLEDFRAQEPVWSQQVSSSFWQISTLEVADEVDPGSTHSYVVVVWDQWGAWTRSEWVSLTAAEPEGGAAADAGEDAPAGGEAGAPAGEEPAGAGADADDAVDGPVGGAGAGADGDGAESPDNRDQIRGGWRENGKRDRF
ncbi:hypothetical protein [Actinomyces wuliandei]|uniref:hypothetical protein n=1 Tax=Actinomyces wuliandei TaxID=2057743 RepID=UPI000FD8CAA5|nr:hypothetical protein [Actinomyces wuliandei]